MNTVVADACPVIFLAKLDRPTLIRQIYPGTILLPASVWSELTQSAVPPYEQQRIREFHKHCRVETVRSPSFPASSLGLADRHVLTLARKHGNSLILTDDNLVRRIALAEGLPVAVTLGTLVRAVRGKLLSAPAALEAVDILISKHQLRIAVDLYQETIRQIRSCTR